MRLMQGTFGRRRKTAFAYVATFLLLCVPIAEFLFFAANADVAHAANQYALSFDGNDRVVAGDLTAIEGAANLTVEAWAKGTDFTNAIVVAKHGSVSNGGSFYIAYINSTTVRFMVTNGSSVRVDHDVTYALDSEWHHFAGVYDGATMRLYIDGVQVGSTSAQTGTIQANTEALIIGNFGSLTWSWVGKIDEVRIWDTARTAQEIQDNMDVEIESATGLVARWGMNEGTGTSVADSSGGGNTGTITGATWSTDSPFGLATVTASAPTSVLGTSATLNGSVTSLGGEDAVDVYFKWGTNEASLDNTTATSTLTETGSFSQNISGLTPETTYYFQAYASGVNGIATSTVGSFGHTALSFDGNDRVITSDLTATEGAGALTLEAWARGTDFVESIIVAKHGGGSGGSYYLAFIDANTVRFMVTNSSDVRVDHDVTYALDSEWHHFAGVYDGATMRLYIDGVQVGGTSAQTGVIDANGFSFIIGDYSNLIWGWSGQIDEVRVWNTARTAQDIQDGVYQEIETGTGLVGRWGLNEGSGSLAEDSSGGGNTGTITGATWTDAPTFNQPPSQPALTTPLDDATDVSLSPTLGVTVEDPDGDPLTVTFYGREYAAPEADFTIMTLPDTQYYSASYPATFAAQTQWIVDNMDDLNIKMVLHKGDVVDDGNTAAQWTNAMTAMNTLKNNNVPTLVSIGNHDYDDNAATRAATFFNTNIDYDTWYFEKPWFDGDTYSASTSENVYAKTDVGGLKYLFMTLEFGPRQAVIDWANGIIAANPDREVMIVTHNYMNNDDTRVGTGDTWNPHTYGIGGDANDGDEMWDELVSLHENIFFVVSGHILGDGKGRLTSVGDNGNTVHQALANYQVLSNGGNGYLRYYTFKPTEEKIYAYTYSPTLGLFDTTADDQFELDYDFGYDYTLLATNTDVSSGAATTHEWSGLSASTTYEWYVAISDGTSTTTGPVWTFTTELSATVPDAPTNLQASAVGTDQIQLVWDAPASDGGSSITGYHIERSVDGGGFSVLVADTGTTLTEYADTGLDSNTLYAYRVSALNAEGTGNASNEASATTGEETPVVSTEAATGITDTAATLQGTLTSLGDIVEADVFFRYRILDSGDSFTDTAVQSTTTTGAFQHALSGLSPETVYEYRSVVTWDSGAQEYTGSLIEFTTDAEEVDPEEQQDDDDIPPESRSSSRRSTTITQIGKDSAVERLVEQIKVLLLQIISLGGVIPQGAQQFLSGETTVGYDRDLTLGDEGSDVTSLQNFLMAQNKGSAAQALSVVGATGFFGPLTQAALAEFQVAVGITPAVGYFGPITRLYITEL